MGWQKINLQKYIAEIKENLKISIADEIVKKDLLLTFILAEFEKHKLGEDLVFKGGTLLSRNFLKYHRFSEDLDFVHKISHKFRLMTRNRREKEIKKFIDIFVPKLKEIANSLDLDFSTDRSNQRYCTIIRKRAVYIFRLYYEVNNYIKIEINFIEEMLNKPKEVSIKVITDFFDSKKLMFDLNLSYENFRVSSYPIEEIIIEKYRALLTRPSLKERDLFDLFLIPNSLRTDIKNVVEKIKNSSLIKKDLEYLIKNNLEKLKNNEFFISQENVEDLAIIKYDSKKFEEFKVKIKPILIQICETFLE
jgi:predicted nucleotidyltransferase component of viral defense system